MTYRKPNTCRIVNNTFKKNSSSFLLFDVNYLIHIINLFSCNVNKHLEFCKELTEGLFYYLKLSHQDTKFLLWPVDLAVLDYQNGDGVCFGT